MKKISIKDIFDTEKNLLESETEPEKKPLQENRMIQLTKALSQKDVVLKDDSKIIDNKKIKKECKRLKEVARIDEWGSNWTSVSQMSGHIPNIIGQGQTVNTFIDPKAQSAGSVIPYNNNLNPNSDKLYNPNFTYLSDAEALRLAISRTLNSGDQTVHKLGFYEEINQILNGLGFNAKSPLSIKEMIVKMMEK